MNPNRHLAFTVLLLAALATTGCRSTRAVVRLQSPAQAEPSGPPTLVKAVDLGALPLAAEGELTVEHSDNVLTPGEWVALLGSELGPGTKVSIAGRPLELAGWLESGSLLVRLPRGVTPGAHTLIADNGKGVARVPVTVASYVWAADTRGDALRFRELGAKEEELERRSHDIPFPKARYAALSPEGALLFALQEPKYDGALTPDALESLKDTWGAAFDKAAPCELRVVHMGGRGGPKTVGSLTLELTTRPTAIAAGPRGLIAVIERRHVLIIDANDPAHPRLLAKLEVATGEPRELADAEFLDDGKRLVVLEGYENTLHLIDLEQPSAPQIAGRLNLADAQPEPFSIDLAPAPGGKAVFALQGPNLRLAGKKLQEGVKNVWNSAKVGFKVPPGAGEAPMQTLSRVVEVKLEDNRLVLGHSVPLPKDLFPFFVASDADGALYVSALHGQNPFDGLTASLDGVVKLLGALRDTAQFSRVIRIDPRTGETTTVLQSTAIYFEVTMLSTGRLLASLTRLGPGYLPPRITLDWGFEIVDGQFVKLREVANTGLGIIDAVTRLLPPYRYERVGAQ
jgi:hypothetical protein